MSRVRAFGFPFKRLDVLQVSPQKQQAARERSYGSRAACMSRDSNAAKREQGTLWLIPREAMHLLDVESPTDGPYGGLCTIVDKDLLQQMLHMLLDGLVTDAEQLRDLTIRRALAEFNEHVVLARREMNVGIIIHFDRSDESRHAPQLVSPPNRLARCRGSKLLDHVGAGVGAE